MGEEQVVHLPEQSLRTCRFGRLRRDERVRVNFLEGKVAERNAYVSRKTPEEQRHRRRCLFAVGTLEVAILDDRDARFDLAADPVAISHGVRQRLCSHGTGLLNRDFTKAEAQAWASSPPSRHATVARHTCERSLGIAHGSASKSSSSQSSRTRRPMRAWRSLCQAAHLASQIGLMSSLSTTGATTTTT